MAQSYILWHRLARHLQQGSSCLATLRHPPVIVSPHQRIGDARIDDQDAKTTRQFTLINACGDALDRHRLAINASQMVMGAVQNYRLVKNAIVEADIAILGEAAQ